MEQEMNQKSKVDPLDFASQLQNVKVKFFSENNDKPQVLPSQNVSLTDFERHQDTKLKNSTQIFQNTELSTKDKILQALGRKSEMLDENVNNPQIIKIKY